jgi:hypothetical protein
VLATSVPCRDAKRLSEKISLYMEEASGRILGSGDLGESLKLCIHDGRWISDNEGVKPFPTTEESRDIVTA